MPILRKEVLMMEITGHTVEKLYDPTGILEGDRYEFFLEIKVPEDDELYTDHGILLRVIYIADDKGKRIGQYDFLERGTNQVLDFALEPEEEESVMAYCREHIAGL